MWSKQGRIQDFLVSIFILLIKQNQRRVAAVIFFITYLDFNLKVYSYVILGLLNLVK